MENSTVWNEHICSGFLSFIKSQVRVRGRDGMIPVENVVVRRPEVAFQSDLLPAVTVYNYDMKRAVVNQMGSLPTYENYNAENGTVEYTEQPLKFWLYYQIDLWAEFQEDIDNMLMSFMRAMPEHGSLEVVTEDGEQTTVSCTLVGMTNLDGTDTDRRLFRRALSYRVSARIDRGYELKKTINNIGASLTPS